MKKILVVASSYYFIRTFLLPHIRHLVEKGWIVHVSSANDGDSVPFAHKMIDIPVRRSPFRADNLKAVKMLKGVMAQERYDIVHCHTPIGAMVARLAARDARRTMGTKVIYTTHGLHFYKGAPFKNWLLFYTAEKFLAQYTDTIVSINDEDRCHIAQYFPEIKQQYIIDGIGYDVERLQRVDSSRREALREVYGYGKEDFVCIYIASFCDRKNHKFLLSHLPQTLQKIPNLKYLFLGEGETQQQCQKMVGQMQLQDKVTFAGYQLDLTDYLTIADVGISASKTEGLGMGLIEEMYAQLPVLATHVRGHCDFIKHDVNGLLFTLNDSNDYIDKLHSLHQNPQLRKRLGSYASQHLHRYNVTNIIQQMDVIYNHL